MFDTNAIAKRIRYGRMHKRRMTQEVFAAEIGIGQSAVSDLENGKKGSGIADLHRLNQLAGSLELGLPYLIFGMGDDGLPRFSAQDTFTEIGLRRIPKAHRKLIEAFLGTNRFKPYWVCGLNFLTYRFYLFKKTEGETKSVAGLLIHDGAIVGTVKGRAVTVADVMKEPPNASTLTIRKRLDPYESLMTLADRYGFEHDDRLRELEILAEESIVVIEAMYVTEAMREHSFARLMIEGTVKGLEAPSLWLSLLPASGLAASIDEETMTPTVEPGQMRLNAYIAERLGLTIEERKTPVTVTNADDSAVMATQTWAYRLNPALQALTDDDEWIQELALSHERLARCEANLKKENN